MKKFLLFLILIGITCCPVFAQKSIIKITPTEKVTTANDKFTEGDYVDFKVVGTDKLLRGLIVKYKENGFGGEEAVLVIDQFRALNSNDKYEGTITLNGNNHWQCLEYFFWIWLIRGGEVTILPDRDVFELWRIE